MDPHWDPDNLDTWNAFFANRQERELARYEGDGPPPVNHNEAGRRLWWANRTIAGVMRYIAMGDHPRLRYPHFHQPHSHKNGGGGEGLGRTRVVIREPPPPRVVNPRPEDPSACYEEGLRIHPRATSDDNDDDDSEDDPEAVYYRARYDYD